MNELDDSQIEVLLQAWKLGDTNAKNKLFDKLYHELSIISAALLKREGGISLSAGDIVNEAALKILKLNRIDWQDKAHFLALSSKVMRQVLVDHCRKKNANKRYHQKVTLITELAQTQKDSINLNELELALQALQEIDPKRVSLVEMRYYGGLTMQQIADALGISESSAKRSWRASRAWLSHALTKK